MLSHASTHVVRLTARLKHCNVDGVQPAGRTNEAVARMKLFDGSPASDFRSPMLPCPLVIRAAYVELRRLAGGIAAYVLRTLDGFSSAGGATFILWQLAGVLGHPCL